MCSNSQFDNMIYDMRTGLDKIFGDKLNNLWLYGSYARGDQTVESDIDIMALVDLSKKELALYRRKVSDFSSDLDLKYGVLLSIKLQDAETFNQYSTALPFFKNVLKEGISLVQ